jgi:hypothetical protein
MDPTANLTEQREIIDSAFMENGYAYLTAAALDRLLELHTTLDNWIEMGGFLPEQWTQTKDPEDLPEPIDYDSICPGVRALVKELREVHGLHTCDSGDGSNLAAGMEGAFAERHVFINCKVHTMVNISNKLRALYPEAHVECSWSPGGPAIVLFWPDGLVLPDYMTNP